MNGDLKEAFSRIKPVCDVLMICPTVESIGAFVSRISELKQEVVFGLQQYLLFPLITHLKSSEIEKKYELQCSLIDAIRVVLEKISVNSFDMCMKIETGVLQLIFDNARPGMIADVPEELKHSAMKTLTVLMLSIDNMFREALMKTQVPLIAQAVFVSVHIAKLEKLRALRLAAINCVTAHTATHPQLTKGYHIRDPALETVTVDTLMSILPGVLAALQDVATCPNNPGHAVVVGAIEAIHRILCVTMHDKHAARPRPRRPDLTDADFAKLLQDKANIGELTEVSSKGKSGKTWPKRSPEWYAMAGDKLLVITKSLVPLRTHEHYKVRKELAIYCSRVIFECNTTMQPSIPLALDILISLAKDEFPEVSERSSNAINAYFAKASDDTKSKTLDSLCDNFFATLTSLPRIMNNIDSSRKLSALNLVHGYIQVLCSESAPQRLTAALSALHNAQCLCSALLETAAQQTDLTLLTRHAVRDVTSAPPTNSPWCKLRHLDSEDCERRLQDICQLLGAAECSEMVLDKLMDLFHQGRDSELAYIMNWMVASPKSSANLAKRILDTYIEENLWYLPLEVGSSEIPVTEEETLDVSVYNPRAWEKDSVPGLYEGSVETRYTGISYRSPRVRPQSRATLAAAQRNMVLSCLLTEGVGAMATRLLDAYDPYLLRTLCLILERVGSKYEMLHLAGLKAINAIAAACGHISAAELIRFNADYFTSQVSARLKKAWHCQSALQILSVVMEFSDSSILNYLYGVVQDVLVQSCDKFYEKDLQAYLQVFLAFVEYIRKWFFKAEETQESAQNEKSVDILKDLREFIANKEEEERLLSEEFEKASGKSVEEMYKEDAKKREDDILEYDDRVTHEKQPLPQHVAVTVTILKRSLNFVVSSNRDNSILSLQVLNRGLPLLKEHEDELLPMVHLVWAPLVAKFEMGEPVVMRRAFDLLVTMAELSKDFIRNRAVKEVLPHIYKYLRKSSKDSLLKDVGSAYRSSQAYQLQECALAALPRLAVHLEVQDEGLAEAMQCVDPYLSKKQPKPLQALAVGFFKAILDYEYGAAWYHLRQVCDNTEVLSPPDIEGVQLKPVVGTPFLPKDVDYEKNIKLIFEHMVS